MCGANVLTLQDQRLVFLQVALDTLVDCVPNYLIKYWEDVINIQIG